MRKNLHKTHRVLTRLDSEILLFIWKWKAANFFTLLYGVAPERSFWKFYNIIRKLHSEGYIVEISDTRNSFLLWTLTKKGFKFIDDGSLALTQKRFKPQAVLHDYWASSFHLCEYLIAKPTNVELVSEQEFTALEIADLPNWVPRTKEHIPDGLTKVSGGMGEQVVAFEVELTAKSEPRYEEMIRYLDQTEEINLVFWLCSSGSVIEKITHKILAVRRRRPMIHNFLLLEDVKRLGWSAPFVWGSLKDLSPGIILQESSLDHVNVPLRSRSERAMTVLRSKLKSPYKFKDLDVSVDPLKILTP